MYDVSVAVVLGTSDSTAEEGTQVSALEQISVTGKWVWLVGVTYSTGYIHKYMIMFTCIIEASYRILYTK